MKSRFNLFYPKCIIGLAARGAQKGRYYGYAMFTDISGFTQLSENLMENALEGAEQIRNILNRHFLVFSRSIYDHGGDIVQFSGDAILSVFNSCEDMMKAAEEIIDFTKEEGIVSVRCGTGSGLIEISIYRYMNGITYLVTGEAVENSMQAEKECQIMEVNFCGEKGINGDIDFFDEADSGILKNDIIELFEKNGLEFGGFAYGAAMFLTTANDDEVINSLIRKIPSGMHLNKIEKYPEGIRFFILAGVPQTESNPVYEMVDFANSLHQSEIGRNIKGGFTSGYMFHGFSGGEERIEYNLIGKVINRAARIASTANNGEILFDGAISENAPDVTGQFKKSATLKGIGSVNLYCRGTYYTNQVPQYFPLFGRDEEKETLSRLFDSRSVIRITGKKGSGKTHFISAFVYENSLSALYLRISRESSFRPLELIRGITDRAGLDMPSDEEVASDETAEHIKKVLDRLSKECNLVIVDNAEYIDRESLEVLKRLEDSIFKPNIILVSAEGEGDIRIKEVDRDFIRGMIELRTGLPPSSYLTDILYNATSGNPYLVITFFRGLIGAMMADINHRNEWDISEGKKLTLPDISTYIQIILSQNTDREKQFLKTLSIFHGHVKREIIADMTESFIKRTDIKDIVNKQIENGIIDATLEGVSYSSDTIREHIYTSMLLRERRDLHSKAAAIYAEAAEYPEAGLHDYLAGDFERAAENLKRAEKLLEKGYTAMALKYLKPLYEITGERDVLEEILKGLRREGRLLEYEKYIKENAGVLEAERAVLYDALLKLDKGDYTGVVKLFNENRQSMKDMDVLVRLYDAASSAMFFSADPNAGRTAKEGASMMLQFSEGNILYETKTAHILCKSAEFDIAEKLYRKAYDWAVKDGDSAKADLVLTEMISMMPTGRYPIDYVIEVHRRTLQMLKGSQKRGKIMEVEKMLSLYLTEAGMYDDALKHAENVLKEARSLNRSQSEISILSYMGRIYLTKGENERALKTFEDAAKMMDQFTDFATMETVFGNMGVAYHIEKDYERAYEYYEKALEIGFKKEHSETRFIWMLNLALVGLESGNLTSVEDYIEMARSEIKKENIPERWIDISQIEGNCYFLQGRYEEAERVLSPVLEESKKRNETELYYQTLPYYGGSVAMRGRVKEGEEMIEEARVWAEKNGAENVHMNVNEVLNIIKRGKA